MKLTNAITILLLATVMRNVAANWTEWSPWTVCTKTCGIGISSSRRHCNNTIDVSECVGDHVRHRTCNIMDCGTGDPDDYRAFQCSQYNNVEHNGKLYRWVPETGSHLPPCALFCRAEETDIVEMKASKILDGTKCNNFSYDICINGNCERVGCDRKLNSGKRADACGVCDGDGTTCRLITGLYRSDPEKNKGSEIVITIPQSSRHITISARGSGHVGLKLQDSPELDVVMPNITEIFSHGVVSSSGLVVNYGKFSQEKEYFDVPGPVPENVEVMALYNDAVWKYIRYEFYRPLTVSWIHNKTTFECTKTCGNGLRFIWPICVDVVTGKERSKKACEDEGIEAPAPKVYRCNTNPCPDSWVADPWTKCSATCGGGFQTRTLQCVEDSDNGESFISEEDTPCYDAGQIRPETKRKCNEHDCPRWEALNWSACSVTCGIGVQHRIVRCLSHDGSPGFNCEESEKPTVMQSCLVATACHKKPLFRVPSFPLKPQNAAFRATITSISFQPSWVPDLWGECSVTCGSGVLTRIVKCKMITKFSKTVVNLPESKCDPEQKPAESRVCSRRDCHDSISISNSLSTSPCSGERPCSDFPQGGFGKWDLGPFSSCTVTCGRGIQTRSVTCREIPEGANQTESLSNQVPSSTTMPEIMCPSPRPHDTQDCGQSACPPQWWPRPWSKCSKHCGRGVQTRRILCIQKLGNGKVVNVPLDYCSGNPPSQRKVCILKRNCPPHFETGPWRPENATRGDPKRLFDDCRRINKFDCALQIPCRSRCGTTKRVNLQSRSVKCVQHQAGRIRPKRRGHRKCFGVRRPASVRKCSHRHCYRKHMQPRIHTSRDTFIQKQFQTKVLLIIGQSATVFPNSNVIIRCRVDSFPKLRIRWYFNGTFLGNGQERISAITGNTVILKNGNLKLVHVSSTNNGFYACAAGTAFARTHLYVSTAAVSSFHISNQFSASSEEFRNTSFIHDISATSNIQTGDEPYTFRKQHVPRFQNSHSLSFVATPQDIVHPNMSYSESVATLEVQESLANKEISTSLLNDRGSFVSHGRHSTSSRNSLLISKVRQILNEDRDGNVNEQISRSLRKIIAVFSSFKSGSISEEAYIQQNQEIVQELTHFLDESAENLNITIRENAELVRDVLSLIEAQTENRTAAPRIVIFPTKSAFHRESDVTAYVGGSLMLTQAKQVTILCETLGDIRPDITWFRDNKEIRSNYRFFILREGSLRIINPQFQDAGTYTCVASNRHGNDSRSTMLTIMRKPRIRSITTTHRDFNSDVVDVVIGSDIRAKLGAKVIIRCPSDGFPDSFVVWSKDGPGLGQNAKVLPDNSLQLYPATAADQGLFACEASNPAGSDYQASSLVLLDPPRLSDEANFFFQVNTEVGLPGLFQTGQPLKTYHIIANTSVLIGCPVTGYPQPHITWFFNNQSLQNLGPVLDYQLLSHNRVLQIPNFGSETEGTYTCHARNDAANLTSSLKLLCAAYMYGYGEISACSASCGNMGIQNKEVLCLKDGAIQVDDWYCQGQTKPPAISMSCNRIDCPPRLIFGEWSACSTSCGKGESIRTPSCVTLLSNGSSVEVAVKDCLRIQNFTIPKKPCRENKCFLWKSNAWSSCSRKCIKRGFALKKRQVNCISFNHTIVNSILCLDKPKPKRFSLCRKRECFPIWIVSRWSACSRTCGLTGIRTRIAKCVYKGFQHQLAIRQCSTRSKPKTKLSCNRRRCSFKQNISARCKDHFSWCHRFSKSRCGLSMRRHCCQSCQR